MAAEAEVVVAVGIVEIVAAEMAEAATKLRPVVVSLMDLSPAIEAPNTLICPLVTGRGVACISSGVGGLIFVAHPPPAPGRTFTPPNLQNNERLTSSPKVTKMI